MRTLRVLGTASIEESGAPVAGRAAQGRRLALLTVLAVARGRVITRDKLIGLLWPEAHPERARPQLSDTLYILRSALGEDVVRSAGDGLVLDTAAIASDVDAFERLLDEERAEEAVELYRGPLLDGFHLDAAPFEEWLDGERARLAHRYAAALQALAEASEGDRPDRAVAWWRRLAAQDPYNGRTALRLMRALHAVGDRAGAIQHARIHAALLREEFDAEPAAELVAFADWLRDEEPAASTAAPAGTTAPTATPTVPAATAASPTVAPPPVPSAATSEHDRLIQPRAERLVPAAPDDAPSSPGAHRTRMRGRWMLAVPIGVLMLILGLVAVRWSRRPAPASAAPPARSVGVLPFVNMSSDEETTYFSDGLSEQIIAALSGIEGLRVAARTSSFALRDRGLTVRAIGDTLGVEAVLEGSVRTDGQRLRIVAQLVDAESGYQIWTDQFDTELADVVNVQDRIASAIAGALELRLADRPTLSVRMPGFEAYDLYLRGLHLRNSLSADALRQAAELFDSALVLEPGFALAWAAKATVIAPLVYFGHVEQAPAVAELRVLTSRALELDPTVGEAHAALGIIQLFFDWDWAGAEQSLRRAIALNPSDAHAWHHLANYHRVMGQPLLAVEARLRAVELDPLNARTRYTLSRDCSAMGDLDCAHEHATRAVQLDPLHPLGLGLGPGLAAGPVDIHLAEGRYAEAVEEYVRIATLRGATASDVDALRAAYAASGMTGFWRCWVDVDMRLSGGAPDPLRMAALWALAGDSEQALDWLERAWAEHNPGLIYLEADRAFAELRKHPRVAAMLDEMGLPARTTVADSAAGGGQ